jgi:hypothetical protein
VAGNKAKMSDDDKPPPVNSGAAFFVLFRLFRFRVEHIDNQIIKN